jgi:hypothetical protein
MVPVTIRFAGYIEPALGCLEAKVVRAGSHNGRRVLKNPLTDFRAMTFGGSYGL